MTKATRLALVGNFICCIFAASALHAGDSDDKAYAHYQQAHEQYQQGDLNQALRLIEQAISLRAYDGTLLIDKQIAYARKGNRRGLQVKKTITGTSVQYRPHALKTSIHKLLSERKERARQIAKSKQQPKLNIRSILKDQDNDGYFQALEEVTLHLELENIGHGDAEHIHVILENDAGLSALVHQWHIETLPARDSWIQSVSFTLPFDLAAQHLRISISAQERDGYSADKLSTDYPITPWQAPDIEIVPTQASPSLVAGRVTPLKLMVRNTQRYPARNVAINVEFDAPGIQLIEQKWPDKFENLLPGEQIELAYSVMADIDTFASLKALAETPRIVVQKISLDEHMQPQHHETLAHIQPQYLPAPERFAWGNSQPASKPIIQTVIRDGYAPKLTPNKLRQEDAYALVIGNRNYNKVNSPVRYAINDARLMQGVFETSLGLPKDHIFVEENATLADLRMWLGHAELKGRLHSLIDAETSGGAETVYIFYSGHGVPAKNKNWSAYLMPTDANPDFIEHSGLALDELYRQLGKLNARRIVVMLDACFSGQTPDGLLFENVSPALLKPPAIPSQTGDTRIAVLSAASAQDMGLWLDQSQQGLFTTYLARGLSGLADNGDKHLTLTELFSYVQQKVHSASLRLARTQTPALLYQQDFSIVQYEY